MTTPRSILLAGLAAACLGFAWLPRGAGPASGAAAGGLRATPSRATTIDFESMPAGATPAGFVPLVAGDGIPTSTWTVTTDSTAPSGTHVLVQTSRERETFHFPLCILEGFAARDVALSVRFKTVGGEMNRSGGLVFRFQDPAHFCLVRFNALEDNVNFYDYDTHGHRILVTGAYHLVIAEEEWHTLRVEARGTHFKVWYDAKLVYELDDETIRTPGKVGLWTKSDSVTYFDDLVIENLDEQK